MEFDIKKASAEDAEAMAAVIQTVYEQIEKKEWYVPDDADYIRRLLGTGTGLGYKAVERESGELAAIFTVAFPGDSPKNLGSEIGFPHEKLLVTATMDSAAVLSQYRGNRLQYLLMQEAERELRTMGYRYLMCTVHPDNRFSRQNILRQGYRVMKTTEKYGGYLRDIMLKEL